MTSHGGGVPAATPGADVLEGAVVPNVTGAAVVGATVGAATTGPVGAPVVALGVVTVAEVVTVVGLGVVGATAEPQTARGPGVGGHAPGQQMESVPAALKHCKRGGIATG